MRDTSLRKSFRILLRTQCQGCLSLAGESENAKVAGERAVTRYWYSPLEKDDSPTSLYTSPGNVYPKHDPLYTTELPRDKWLAIKRSRAPKEELDEFGLPIALDEFGLPL